MHLAKLLMHDASIARLHLIMLLMHQTIGLTAIRLTD